MLSVFVAVAGWLLPAQAVTSLGFASSFAVLGGSTVTSTGPTVLNGDLGVFPGLTITGFSPGIVNGVTYAGGAVAQSAQNDVLIAYLALLGEASVQDLTGQNLGGLTLAPGVRNFTSSAQLTGILTLDGLGNPNSRFDFQIGSTLTTASCTRAYQISPSIMLLPPAAASRLSGLPARGLP